MSEDRTRELTDARSFEERVLALFDRVFMELAATRAEVRGVRDWQDKLEEKVDRRLQETRPLWEAIMPELQRLSAAVEELQVAVAENKAAIEENKVAIEELKATTEENKETLKELKEGLKRLNTKFEIVVEELYEYRTDMREQRKEIIALESRITRLEEANRV